MKSEKPLSSDQPSELEQAKEVAKDMGVELAHDLVKEGRRWLRWTLWGAIPCAILLAIAGGVLFGPGSILTGLAAGAIVGGVSGFFLYGFLTSF